MRKDFKLTFQAVLTLSEPTSSSLLTQHYTLTSERDKFLLIYVLLKLKLIRGKSIIFVNDVERGYRVKLFLEQFGVKTCVVNSELPLASRYHVVEEFNRGVYDVVVATDEATGVEDEDEAKEEEEEEEGEEKEGESENADEAEEAPAAGPSKRRRAASPAIKGKATKRRRGDPASSMARGIDFTSASSVINFDLPTTTTAYLHRVGRTARAGHSGLALSFIVPRKDYGKDRHVSVKSAEKDEQIWEKIKDKVKKENGSEMKEWDWGGRKGEIEGFRYRMEDALKAVTGKRVADARREEVRRELLNSEKLKVGCDLLQCVQKLTERLISLPTRWTWLTCDMTHHCTRHDLSRISNTCQRILCPRSVVWQARQAGEMSQMERIYTLTSEDVVDVVDEAEGAVEAERVEGKRWIR